MSKQNNFIFEEGETAGVEIMKLNEMYYNCTECSSPIEILCINEKVNIIEFKCTINNHIKKLSIKEYIKKMKKFNNKKINDDICIEDNHNKKYEFFCLVCNKHLCKECLKTRNHINHNKKIIIEILPSEKELNIIDNMIKCYEETISNLEKDKFNKIKEMKNKLKESENKLKEKNEIKIKENKIKMEEELKIKNEEYFLNKQNIKDKYENELKLIENNYEQNKNEITNKYKAIDDNNKNIYEKELSNLNDKYKRKIQRYNYDEYIENLDYLKRLNEIIYNTYNIYNNNYYNSININNILINIFNNKTYINDDLNDEYENIIKIKNETINNKNNKIKNKYNTHKLDNIISFGVFTKIFSFFSEKKKLEIIHYNKRIQNNLDVNIKNYQNFKGKYLKYETIVKEYKYVDDRLIIEGEYFNEKRNENGKNYYEDDIIKYAGKYLSGKKMIGKGSDYDSNVINELKDYHLYRKEYYYNGKIMFEGEYLNGERNGKGKEYYDDGKVKYDGKYLNGKKWNGKGFDKKNNLIYKLKDGKGYLKEYDDSKLIYTSFDSILDKNGKELAKKMFEYKKIFFRKKKHIIKYNYENELIYLNEKEIKSLISEYIIKSGKKEELNEKEIFDSIFKKISRTFSQELIAYLNHYNKDKYYEEVNKINHFYANSIHSNLETFVKRVTKSINVIYTFTPTIRSTKLYFQVENESIGTINGENIKYIYINLIKTERQLEIEMYDFYDSENKLMLINFEESDADILEYVLAFLKKIEKEKNSDKLEKKIIIILIHLRRKKEAYNLDILVPTLSGIEQTFIDNLFGKDILIFNIISQSMKALYANTKLIDVHELFVNELYCCFQKIEYSFQDNKENQKDYINNIINIILNDENLINRIIKLIINEIEKSKSKKEESENENELVYENERNSKNFYDEIFEKQTLETDIDFVSIVSNELKELFVKYLNKFIINSEKLTILSSLPKNLKKCAIKIWENLLDNLDFSKEINDNLKSNKIKIWTKLHLPSIKSIDFIKNIIANDTEQLIGKYLEKEKEIRKCGEPADIIPIDEENEEGEIEFEEFEKKKKLVNEFFSDENNDIKDPKFEKARENIKQFFLPSNDVINYVKRHIEKDNFIKKFDPQDKEELLALFFQDYFSQIITLLIQSEDDFYYDLLVFLFNLRFGEKPKENSLDYYSKCILWIHIYKDELIYLLKNFQLIKTEFPDILKAVKSKIESKEIQYIISSHHPRHRRLIDKPFLLILDSFFFNLIEIIETLNGPKILSLMNIFSDIVENSEIYNSNLSLKSKDFYRFKTLFISIKLFKEKQVYKKEETDLYINFIKNERRMILEGKNEKVAEEIKNQINILMEKLPECEEKAKTIMKILILKYKEITDISCRELLCDIVLSDNNLIKISNEFFIHILDIFEFIPDSLDLENDSPDNPFSNSVENNSYYPLLKKIEEKVNSKILSENLKYIFKFKIFHYYEELINQKIENNEEKIRNDIDIYLGEQSLNYFIIAHNLLMEIINSNKKIKNKNIKKIFCIVYCSFFLEKFVFYAFTQKILISKCRNEIINFLSKGTSQIKKTLKLFILKELKSKYIIERTEFLNLNKWVEEYQLNELFHDLKFQKQSTNQLHGSLEKIFFSGYDLEELQYEKQNRSLFNFTSRNLSEKQLLCNIDLFINENISTLKTEEGQELCKNSGLMKNFYNYINTKNYSNSTKKLIKLFFQEEEYNNKLANTIKETNYFEIILYAYKFSIMCSLSNNNSIYYKMISGNIVENLKNVYIPGADLFCDLWVESYLNMKNPISKNHRDGYSNGYYICDCGEYYFELPSGFPTNIRYCVNCFKEIGGLNEELVKREEDNGVYKIIRIYPDEKNKNDVHERHDIKRIYGEHFERGYDYKIFKDFEKEILDKMNSDYKGIQEPSYLLFINETKSIRKMSNQITYRLLNFIIYSNIYFGLKCGYLTLDDINKNVYIPKEEKPYEGSYTIDDSYSDYRARLLNERKKGITEEKNILEILRLNWALMEKKLKEKNVNSIKIFLNSIIVDLFEFMKNSNEMSTPQQRNIFEYDIDNFINNSILDYVKKSGKYIKSIDKIMSNYLEIEYQILEKENMIDNVESKYPFYYEFLSIPLVKEEDIKERLKLIKNAEKRYPVLYSYLNADKKSIEYLQTLKPINNFVNYTIEHYSNVITREEARNIKISKEIGYHIPFNLFNEYLMAFNNHKLYEIAIQFECHKLKPELRSKLTKDDLLSNFLIDNEVSGRGMQIAALYQKYIEFQNKFLDSIIYNIP